MSQTDKSRLKGGIKGDAARRERLAAELRANLRKRKAQSRLRAGDAGGQGGAGVQPRTPGDGNTTEPRKR